VTRNGTVFSARGKSESTWEKNKNGYTEKDRIVPSRPSKARLRGAGKQGPGKRVYPFISKKNKGGGKNQANQVSLQNLAEARKHERAREGPGASSKKQKGKKATPERQCDKVFNLGYKFLRRARVSPFRVQMLKRGRQGGGCRYLANERGEP